MAKFVNVRITKTEDFMIEIEDGDDKDVAENIAIDVFGNNFDKVEAEDISADRAPTYLRHADTTIRL